MTIHDSELHSLLQTILDWHRHHEQHRDELPVRPHGLAERVERFIEPELADDGVGAVATLGEALERIAPAMANMTTRDFSLVIGGSTPAASAGDVLATLWDQCVTATQCFGVAAMRLAMAKWDTNHEHIDAVQRSLAKGMMMFRNQQ